MTRPLDPAIKLQRMEARQCWCGGADSGEGHADECDAKKFDRIPQNMGAAKALVQTTRRLSNGHTLHHRDAGARPPLLRMR